MNNDESFARHVIEAGLAKPADIAEAREMQAALAQLGEPTSLPLILIRLGILSPRRARDFALRKKPKGRRAEPPAGAPADPDPVPESGSDQYWTK